MSVGTTVDSVDLNEDLLNFIFHISVGQSVLLLNSFDMRTTIVPIVPRPGRKLFYQTLYAIKLKIYDLSSNLTFHIYPDQFNYIKKKSKIKINK